MNITHEILDDGLTLESTYLSSSGGSAKVRVSWDTLEKAEQNYDKAKLAFAERIPYYESELTEEEFTGTKHSRLRRLGPLQIYTNQGPPTWWLPRLGFVKYGIKFGWLRLAVLVSWEGKR